MSGPAPGYRSRGLFWPALLIGLGVLALLINTGVIPADRLYRLADLWPAVLIVAGLALILRRSALPARQVRAAVTIVLVLAVAGAAVYVAAGPPQTGGSFTTRSPLEGLKEATLEIDVGSATLNVQGSSSLFQDLFQAQISYSGPAPTLSLDRDRGRLVVSQSKPFGFLGRQSIDLHIQLNPATRWHFVVHSGSSTGTFDAGNLDLRSMEIDTGASREVISLGFPNGIVPVRINGGSLTVHLHRSSGAAASVKVSGGAVSLDFDGDHVSAFGSVSRATAPAGEMFDVSINGGACTVTMDTGSGLD